MDTQKISRYGFHVAWGGAHMARTMMLDELRLLLTFTEYVEAGKDQYFRAINDENCLGKRSGRARKITARHLSYLYGLDPSVTIFRTMRFFWHRDEKGQPLLALMCAYARDAVLRLSFPYIQSLQEGTIVTTNDMIEFLEKEGDGRFSKATLKSTAQNLNGTWTKSGHLLGMMKKKRATASPTPGSTAYALFLGYLLGARGTALFETEYSKLLDCSFDRAIELAEDASRRGWINFKRVGTVIEVLFPGLLTEEEMGWIREQD